VNVPIGIIAIVLAVLLMPELTIHRKHHIDVVGMVLATAGLFALVFGLIEGERYNWGRISNVGAFNLGSIHAGLVSIPSILFLSAVLLAAFIWWEAREEEPLLPLSLFHDRNFTVGNIVSAVVAFAMLGLFLPMTIFLQSVLGLSAEEAGVVFVPMSLTSMFVAPISGRLADRFNGKYLLFGGLVLFSLGMGLVIWSASLTSTGLSFTPALVLAGIGMGFTFAPLVTLSMRHIAPTQAGAASGFLNTMRQVGGAFGSAVVGAVLQNRLGYELSHWAVHFAAQLPARFRVPFIQGFSQAGKSGFQLGRGQTGGVPTHLPGVPPAVAQHMQSLGKLTFDHAFLNAMKPALGLSIVVMAAGAVLTFLMRTPAEAAEEASAPEERPSGVAAAGE
jgi:Na+/melibiose symporter-like transporter